MEVDPIACNTLQLRTFFHLSKGTSAQDDYYACVRGEISKEKLALDNMELWRAAQDRVVNVELGAANSRLSTHRRIHNAVSGKDFVLIGGPPCQAYSIIGRSRRLGVGANPTDSNASRARKKLEAEFYSDPKHRLYREYLEIIAVHRPAAFVMENVKGLGSARSSSLDEKGGMFELIKADLKQPAKALQSSIHKELTREFGELKTTGYRLFALSNKGALFADEPTRASDFVLQSEDYGVPQARHRVIVLGLRDDIEGIPRKLAQQSPVSAREVLEGLPALRSSVSRSDEDWCSAIASELSRIPARLQSDLQIPKWLRAIRSKSRRMSTGGAWLPGSAEVSKSLIVKLLTDSEIGGFLQHEARSHMRSDLVRYLYCAAFADRHGRSPSIEEWPASLRPSHKNVKSHRGKLRSSGFLDRFKVQGIVDSYGNGRPSSTVTSHIAKDGHYYIHFDPTQCRSLSVREAARLQTFPDNYFFCGNRTQQYQQVGNAVPPFLARQIAAIVAGVVAS